MKSLYNLSKYFFEIVLSIIFYPVILFFSFFYKSNVHQSRRIVWGPDSINHTKTNADLLKKYGLISESYVDVAQDNKKFDNYYFKNNKIFFKTLHRYLAFLDILRRFDIIVTNFDGGFLRYTNLRYVEHFFLKIGLKKIIVWPYGGDSTVYTEMSDYSFRYGYYKSYPRNALRELEIKNLINYFNKNADFIVGNIPHHESIPRWDMLTVACYGVDTNLWAPFDDYKSIADGLNQTVSIFHPTNHRYVKGTEFLIKACNDLKKEGLKINLIIAENMPYDEVQVKMRTCDIVAAQVLYGYALAEIEGMSLEKPVISNLENSNYYKSARNFTYFKECPIISVDLENLKTNLKDIITNPKICLLYTSPSPRD